MAARAAGQTSIAVHLFSFTLTADELARHADSPHAGFWRSLQAGYQRFEQQRQP